jgi:C-terminal processing protease CtpA/Prc
MGIPERIRGDRIIAVIALLLFCFSGPTTADEGPANLDLEKGEPGKMPEGWKAAGPSSASYKVELCDELPKSGKLCARISRFAKERAELFSSSAGLTQSFDATAYRGQRVRLRAAVRTEVGGWGHYAQLWLRINRKDKPDLYENRGDRAITNKDWRDYEVLAEVPEDAVSISIGMTHNGDGKAWLDAVAFEVVGKAGEGNEPARALEDRGLNNLVAFAKLLGYVRYFHPSDEASEADWERFAIEHIRAVEGATTPANLARILEEAFHPIAPTVRIYPTGNEPKDDAAPAKDSPSHLYWRHFGVGTGTPRSIYSSRRINGKEPASPIPGRKLPEVRAPDPAKPFIADLRAGVSCRVPLALPTDEKGTLPRAFAKPPASSKPAGFVPSGNDRSTRLAAVILAWNIFQHFYPYFDVIETDWSAELRRALGRAATDADERAFLDTLRRLVAALEDGHGNVGTTHAAASTAFLPLLWDWIEDRLVVTRVSEDADGGPRPGDVVVRIDGRPAAEALAKQEELISGATVQWRRHNALRTLLTGPKDVDITLDVLSPSGVARTIRLRRTHSWLLHGGAGESRPSTVETIKPDIMYVNLGQITDKAFQDALPKLEKARGIIFDLRGYPRLGTDPIAHITDKPVTCAQWHIPVTVYPDRKDVSFSFSNWQVQPKKPRFSAKVAFLTDGRAISYAETYMGIIEHYKLAEIVGGPTAGTNGNINPFALPGGYRISWTGMKVLKHDGSRHHGVGIQPTIPVSRTIKGVAEGRDEVLERAIEAVKP